MNKKEIQLDKLYKDYSDKMYKSEAEISNSSKKIKAIEEKQDSTFELKLNILKFWDNIMELQSKEGYGPEMRNLESTRDELLLRFQKVERDLQNEYEELKNQKNTLKEKQEQYKKEYTKEMIQLKEK